MSDMIERIQAGIASEMRKLADEYGTTPQEVQRIAAEQLARLRALPAAQPAQGEAVAWRHTMHYEPGCGENVSLTTQADHPFGKPGKDYSPEYEITSQPLYAHPPTPPDSAGAELDALVAEGPQNRELKTCKGCVHFHSEYWREPSGDGETYDSGTSAECKKAGKSISTYYGSEPAPPEWCPCPSLNTAITALRAKGVR